MFEIFLATCGEFVYTCYCIYMAKKYLLYIHNDSMFDSIKNKSGLINELLDGHFNFGNTKKIDLKPPKIIDTHKIANNIPGVMRASEVSDKCTGHPNFRRNCGRKGCGYTI